VGFFVFVSVYRAIHFWTTGFFVPDEYGYVYFAWIGALSYQGHYFFNDANALFFYIFGTGSVDKLVVLLPLYTLMWSLTGVFSAYSIMKLLGFSDNIMANAMLISLTLPIFDLFSASLLTEPVVFGVTMLGIYFTVRFVKSQDGRFRYLCPPLAALCFSAAAYTRIDFVIFQVLGVVPFVYAELARGWKKPERFRKVIGPALVAGLAFAIPAGIFVYYPSQSGINVTKSFGQSAAVVIAGVTPPVGTSVTTTTGISTVTSKGTTIVTTTTATITTSPPPLTSAQLVQNAVYIYAFGLAVGFNPIIEVIILASFLASTVAFLVRRWDVDFSLVWLAFLCLAVFAGVSIVLAPYRGMVSISEIVRYSYDSVPAYFLLMPLLLKRVTTKAIYVAVIIGFLLYALTAAAYYQPVLQSGLGPHYPFTTGHDPFLTLQYRTPDALVRDYFAGLPTNQSLILFGENYGIVSDWGFTPGFDRVPNLKILPYVSPAGLASLGVKQFYVYSDKDTMLYTNATYSYFSNLAFGNLSALPSTLPFMVVSVSPIYSSSSWAFVKVTIA
jgi:hypothetical protein